MTDDCKRIARIPDVIDVESANRTFTYRLKMNNLLGILVRQDLGPMGFDEHITSFFGKFHKLPVEVSYDFGLAIFTGIITGIIVDFAIRYRERARQFELRALVYRILVVIVIDILLYDLFIRVKYNTTVEKLSFSGRSKTYNLIYPKDKNLLSDDQKYSEAVQKLKIEIADTIRAIPNYTSPDRLRSFRMRLEQVLFFAGRSEIEDKIMTVLLNLNDNLFELIGYSDGISDNYGKRNLDSEIDLYTNKLIQTCVEAEWLREKLYSIGCTSDQKQEIEKTAAYLKRFLSRMVNSR